MVYMREKSNPHENRYGDDAANDETDKRLIELDKAQQEKLDNFTFYKRVSDYVLGKTIGEGSFARVRLGLHVHTAQEVAVKIINKAKASKDAYVHKNLRREGRILQMARHQSIIQLYDILETYNNYYLVTEYCGGGELIDIVTDRGGLPEADVRKYVSQLVSAVAHLHDHGIVHRDLKVENLILDQFGDLKVIDFGLSNIVSYDAGKPYGALSTQCGSPAYAAPELLAKKSYGPNVDVWSIGVITYAMIVGKLPFSAEPFRIPVLCRKMLAGDMNPIPSHLSYNCRSFIKRLMTPEPKSRPPIRQVQRMPWVVNMIKPSSLHGQYGGTTSPRDIVDHDIVNEMVSKYGFDSTKVVNCVRKNRPGEALTMYFLLRKHKKLHKNAPNKDVGNIIGTVKDTEEQTVFGRSDDASDFHPAIKDQLRDASDCDQLTTATCTEKSHNSLEATAVKNQLLTPDTVVDGTHQSCSIKENHCNENLSSTDPNKSGDQSIQAENRISNVQLPRQTVEPICSSTKHEESDTHPDPDDGKIYLTLPKDHAKSISSHNVIVSSKSPQHVQETINGVPGSSSDNDNKQSFVRISQNESKGTSVDTTAKASNSICDLNPSVGHSTFTKRVNTPHKSPDKVQYNARSHETHQTWRVWCDKAKQKTQKSDSSRDLYHPISISKRSSNKITPLFTPTFHQPALVTHTKASNSLANGHVSHRQLAKTRSGEMPRISVKGSDTSTSHDLPIDKFRYKFRTFTSREMTKSLRNRGSVKEMIEKFDCMADNEPPSSHQISSVATNHTSSHLTMLDEKRHSIRNETTDKLPYRKTSKPVIPPLVGSKYFSSRNEKRKPTKCDNSNFLLFFRGRRNIRTTTEPNRSASPTKDTKQPVRGLWYQSLV